MAAEKNLVTRPGVSTRALGSKGAVFANRGLWALIILAGYGASPAWAQAGSTAFHPSPVVAALSAPALLASLCLLLAVALLWLGMRFRQQRSQAQFLSAQALAQSDELRQQNKRLEATLLEKGQLELKLREQAEAFERLANEDDLSGLPNRRAFDEVLARDMAVARRAGRALSLVVLSIDHLRQINTEWSRAVGDLVLCEVGELMRRSLRASDMPARLGNKEFAVLLTDTALPEAEIACQRLQRLFAQYAEWGGHEADDIKVSFSAGVVQLREDDQAPVLFYQRAKNALATAKREGSARTCMA